MPGIKTVSPGHAGKESKDHEKENVRRMREIQRKCKEKELAREHSQPKPVKALWKSQKYENVESKVKAKLQVPAHCPLALHGPLPQQHEPRRSPVSMSRRYRTGHFCLDWGM